MSMWISLFFPIIYYIFTMDKLTYDINKLSEDRICVEVSVSGVTLGLLYFEKPKSGWNKKPILPTKWGCVDAQVEGLYEYGGDNITPKQIISHCQELIENL
jgi:hypothetical protein